MSGGCTRPRIGLRLIDRLRCSGRAMFCSSAGSSLSVMSSVVTNVEAVANSFDTGIVSSNGTPLPELERGADISFNVKLGTASKVWTSSPKAWRTHAMIRRKCKCTVQLKTRKYFTISKMLCSLNPRSTTKRQFTSMTSAAAVWKTQRMRSSTFQDSGRLI